MKHVHFIGIGGSGLSAIARLLLESGYKVSGSDRILSPLACELESAGAQVFAGHDAQNILGADLVVRSSAIPDENPEVQAARSKGIPVLKRADFLGQLMAGRTRITVAGTHGKTTTTAMIAWMLVCLDQDPSYIIGGVSKDLASNAHAGRGRYFVIEADEYDHMFLGLQPDFAIVTNVEYDHPDCYPNPASYQQAFAAFVRQVQPGGRLLVCQDDPGALGLAAEVQPTCQVLTYGLGDTAHYRARQLERNENGGFTFHLAFGSQKLAEVALQVPGEHNVRNAVAALGLAHQTGLPLDAAGRALARYSGTRRRFDILGEVNRVIVMDDYAHHPTEIRATLAAARARFPQRRLWVVWQPHTYSRTRSLLAEFAQAFGDADRVIVTEIYAAREQAAPFSAEEVVAQMSHPAVRFIPALDDVVPLLLEQLQPEDVLLVLSAGDADQISARVLQSLATRYGGSIAGESV